MHVKLKQLPKCNNVRAMECWWGDAEATQQGYNCSHSYNLGGVGGNWTPDIFVGNIKMCQTSYKLLFLAASEENN